MLSFFGSCNTSPKLNTSAQLPGARQGPSGLSSWPRAFLQRDMHQACCTANSKVIGLNIEAMAGYAPRLDTAEIAASWTRASFWVQEDDLDGFFLYMEILLIHSL